MHWADVIAKELMAKNARNLISTGITPSGFIHVGSLREAVTARGVYQALKDSGADVDLIYIIDSFDPLRKRYPFLDESYEAEVQKPLSEIPCPCGEHSSYVHHFAEPFLQALEKIGLEPRLYWTHELYQQGKFAQITDIAIRKRDTIAKILREVTGRAVGENFFPYTAKCSACGKYSAGEVLGYEFPYVTYRCHCGHEGKADVRKADGKMPWRVEWAAKWKLFGVTCEPFGKDHAAAGGSYDTGVRFAREVFVNEPPYPIPYEFVQLKGKGQMHKSKGVEVTGLDALAITPAPVFNYSFLRYNVDRHIDYDSGLGVLDVVDEYDKVEYWYYKGGAEERDKDLLRAYELAQPKGVRRHMPLQVPYRHLVQVVQITNNFDLMLEILKRSEHISEIKEEDVELLRERARCVRYWLDHFAPEEVKFKVAPALPTCELSDLELRFLREVHAKLIDAEWSGDKIHDLVYECAKSSGLGAKAAFQTLYAIFINKRQGPRLGYFLSTLDREFVLKRIEEAFDPACRVA
ncbi:MAG: lysine--tRNA ligase [Methanomassiliicoccales archaeon]